MKKNVVTYLLFGIVLLCSPGCEKYLQEKSDRKLVVPSTLKDLQSILDHYSKNVFSEPGSGEVSSADYYLTDAHYNALSRGSLKRMYTWENNNLFEPASNEWTYGYTSVYSANAVLMDIDKVETNRSNINDWNDIKGQALFIRAKAHLKMAFIWTLAYDEGTADTDLGLPLRLTTDFNEESKRSTLRQTYDQIIADLKESARLLPTIPIHAVRPSKPAAYGLLARTYLSMRKYEEAGLYADSCLQLYNTLIDYNTLNVSANYPFRQFNEETIHFGVIGTPAPINPSRAKIDPELYAVYADNDIRKAAFFRRNTDGLTYAFKGNYTGTLAPFDGVSTNEIYLIRAEANARKGKTIDAMRDLNELLAMRHTDTFVPLTASSPSHALDLILLERRKELLMRGLRWVDIKRLNKEGAAIILRRTVEGVEYILPPNDLRYALPIPEDVITLSGIEQNKR